jgi:surfactin synthase thioesterase subunit
MVVANGPPPDRFPFLANKLRDGIDTLIDGLARLYGRESALAMMAADANLAQMVIGIPSVALNVRMTAVWGEQDMLVSPEDLLDWVRFVSGSIDFRKVPCGHSPPTEVPEMLAAIVRSAIHV